jgi:hypothetical protein
MEVLNSMKTGSLPITDQLNSQVGIPGSISLPPGKFTSMLTFVFVGFSDLSDMKLYWPLLILVSCSTTTETTNPEPIIMSLIEDKVSSPPDTIITTPPEIILYTKPDPVLIMGLIEISFGREDYHLRGPVKSFEHLGDKQNAYLFDEAGMLVQRGESKYSYVKDQHGNIIEKTEHAPVYGEPGMEYVYRYTYTYLGDHIVAAKAHEYHPDKNDWELVHAWKFKYDEKGRLIERQVYTVKKGQEEFWFDASYSYDDKNNMTDVSGVLFYTYNEYGELVEAQDDYGNHKYRYEYDPYGNWIVQWSSTEGGQEYSLEREITYY